MSKGKPWREWGHGDCLSGEMRKTMLFCLCLWPILQLELRFYCWEWLHWDTFWLCLWTPTLLEVLMLVRKLLHTCPFKDALRSSERPPCPASKLWAWAAGTAGRTEQMESTCAERHNREELWIWWGEFSNPSNTACTSKWGHVEGRINKSYR